MAMKSTYSAILVHDKDGKMVVTLGQDGTVTFGEGVTPDEAALQFWESLKFYMRMSERSIGYGE